MSCINCTNTVLYIAPSVLINMISGDYTDSLPVAQMLRYRCDLPAAHSKSTLVQLFWHLDPSGHSANIRDDLRLLSHSDAAQDPRQRLLCDLVSEDAGLIGACGAAAVSTQVRRLQPQHPLLST